MMRILGGRASIGIVGGAVLRVERGDVKWTRPRPSFQAYRPGDRSANAAAGTPVPRATSRRLRPRRGRAYNAARAGSKTGSIVEVTSTRCCRHAGGSIAEGVPGPRGGGTGGNPGPR